MNRILLLVALIATTACGDQLSVITGVACETDADCLLAGATGSCQSNGFCAYPDTTCVDGMRYSPGATDVGNQCVGGDTCGSTEGAACCDGVCGTNLACSTTNVCECGGAGQPCCGGTTCDGSATCSAGTCSLGIAQVGLAFGSTCVLRTDGVVQCWGSDARRHTRKSVGGGINIGATGEIAITGAVDLGRGDTHACVRKMDGTVWCWGHNDNGQLGNGTTTGSATPVQVSGLSAVTQLSVGRMHSCAVGTVASVAGLYCWGKNGGAGEGSGNGRLGNNSDASSPVPVAVDTSQMTSSGQTIRQVVAGAYHTCAITSDERLWCWGFNTSGVLGTNDTTSTSVPVLADLSQVTMPSGVTLAEVATGWITGGYTTTTALRLSDGAVYVWGSTNGGATGDGTGAASRLRPTSPVDLSSLGAARFTKLAMNGSGVCAIDSDKKVWCWGSNFQGANGNNVANGQGQANAPVLVEGLPATIESIDGGHRATCAIDADKHLWCWGNNRRGQLTRVPPSTLDEGRLIIARDVTP